MTASISTPRTDALVEPAMDMDGAALLVRFDKLSRLARELEATCGLIAAETRRLAFPETAEICAKQALEGECPERAHYCAEAIRAKARELRSLHAAVESAHPPAAPEGLEHRLLAEAEWYSINEGQGFSTDDVGEARETAGLLREAAALLQSRDATIEGLRAELAEAKDLLRRARGYVVGDIHFEVGSEVADAIDAALAERQGG